MLPVAQILLRISYVVNKTETSRTSYFDSQDVLAKRIIGKEVQPTVISEELYSFSRDFGQRGTYVEAISGIDVALWDLLGKRLGVPVCKLLGGNFRDRVMVYATGCYYR